MGDEFTAAMLAVADDPEALDRLVELAESDDVEAVANEPVVQAESVGPKGPPPFPGAVFDPGRHRWVKPQGGDTDGDKIEIEFDDDPQPEDVSPSSLTPVNEVIPEKVDALAKNMMENGWDGGPLIAVGGQALTGSHRLAAAEKAGIDSVPVISVDEGRFNAAALKSGLVDGKGNVRIRDDDDTLIVLKKMGYDEYSDVIMAMQDEVDNNRSYGGEQWKRSQWAN